jgi:hypothetical protein
MIFAYYAEIVVYGLYEREEMVGFHSRHKVGSIIDCLLNHLWQRSMSQSNDAKE